MNQAIGSLKRVASEFNEQVLGGPHAGHGLVVPLIRVAATPAISGAHTMSTRAMIGGDEAVGRHLNRSRILLADLNNVMVLLRVKVVVQLAILGLLLAILLVVKETFTLGEDIFEETTSSLPHCCYSLNYIFLRVI
jgi:hypothetical protein